MHYKYSVALLLLFISFFLNAQSITNEEVDTLFQLSLEELMNIKSKWMRVPMGLNDKQLEHYFMTGEVLEEEVKEEIIDDTSMRMPPVNMTEQKQVASVKPQVPLNAANVSSEVIASKPDQNTVGSTGLTAAETAYLSNEEKAMKLKQTGRA